VSEIKSLGRYEIKGVLGQGAMGLVYDGLDPGLNRRVAIKTILTRKLDAEAAKMVAVRFEREVRAVAKLNHPNIVQVYDFGSEGDLAFIVMEFVKGKELKSYFDAHERFDLQTIIRLMMELLDALHLAHEEGIVHRDIKPANVLVDSAMRAKLTDFGVARVSQPEGGEQAEATRVGAMVGTPAYMSPEQVQGQKIDRRADIFSAGILFYELLTGKKPFEGTQWGLAKMIIEDDPVWPSVLVQIPVEFDRVVARALAKAPEDRYQTARKFHDALGRILEGKQPEEPGEAVIQPKKPAPPPPASRPSGGGEAEKEFWNDVKDSDDPDEIELYLEQFPGGTFAEEAKKKLAELKG
jgi:serine/threonine protein kinase